VLDWPKWQSLYSNNNLTRRSNEEGLERIVLHNEEILAWLKSTNDHAMHNVLKH